MPPTDDRVFTGRISFLPTNHQFSTTEGLTDINIYQTEQKNVKN